MKHGEPKQRMMGLKLPAPNLKPYFEQQAQSFVERIAGRVLANPSAAASRAD